MEKYTFEGVTYNVAPNRLEEFLQKYPNAVKYEEPGKTTDSSIETQTTESNVMGSKLDDGSSEQSEISQILQGLPNIASNTKESLINFVTKDLPAAIAQTYKTVAYDDLYDEEELKKLKTLDPNATYEDPMGDPTGFKTNADRIKYLEGYKGTSAAKQEQKINKFITEKYKEIELYNKYLRKDTGEGIVKGVKQGDASDIVLGVFNAGAGMVETVVPAMATGGWSLPFQITAPMITSYNQQKAETVYGKDDPDAVEKLLKNKEDEIAVPAALGLLASSFEYIGFKGVSNYMLGKAAKGVTASLLLTGNREGITELGQSGTDEVNIALAQGKEGLDVGKAFIDGVFSEKGLESYLQGFIGGTGMSAGGRAINRALRSDEASVKELNGLINNLADLNIAKNSATNPTAKEAIEVEMKEAEQALKNYVTNKRKIADILNEDQKENLIDAINEKDNITSKVESLKSQLNNNEISPKEFGYAVRSLNNQNKRLTEQIEVINAAAKEQLLQTSLETTKKESEKLGLEQIELSKEEFAKQFPDDANSDGAIVDGKIYINRDVARETGAIGVGSHELLHGIIGNSYQKLGKEEKVKLNTEFLNLLGSKEKQAILTRLANSYGITGDKVFETEELFTAFSDEIVDGGLAFNEGVFGKIKNTVHKVLNKFGYRKEFENARQTYNFLKDYSKNIKQGKLTERATEFAEQDPGVEGTRLSKTTAPETLVKTIKRGGNPRQVKAAEDALVPQYQALAIEALGYTEAKGDIRRENVISAVNEYYEAIVRNYDPKKGAFSTHVYNNIAPKNDTIFEKAKTLAKRDESISIDTREAREVAGDAGTTTNLQDTFVQKINILKDFTITDRVANKIKSLVKVAEGDTFKQVISKHAGKVGELIFDIPAKKIMKGGANLVPTTKYKEGMPIPSEAQNIQRFFNAGENMSKFIKSLPLYNVADKTADIDKIGENIETPRNVFGVAIGLKGLPLDYFYENYTDPRSTSKDPEIKAESITSPKGRSRGLTTQTQVKKLKPEFINPTPEVIEKAKRDIGITPINEPNVYNRDIGQLQKGFAKVYSINASLSGGQRFLADKLAKAPTEKKPAIKKQIAGVTAAQGKAAFSKSKTEKIIDINVSPNFEGDVKNVNSLLKDFIKKGKYKFDNEASVNQFYEDVENVLIKSLPKGYITKRILRPSGRVLGANRNKQIVVDGKKMTIDSYYTEKRNKLLSKKDLVYGKPFTGKAKNFTPKTYKDVFGNSAKSFEKANKNGKIKEFNEVNKSMHRQLWQRINESITENKDNARIWGSYFSTVSLITEHPHRLGAEFVGWSPKPKGFNGKLYEWEHAMPASQSYLYLLESILDPNFDFDLSYQLVMDNYKLVALDNFVDKTSIKQAGRTTSMGKGWSMLDGSWLDRYFKGDIDIDARTIVGLDGRTFEEIYSIPRLKKNINKTKTLNKAGKFSRSSQNESKGITVLDFDDTLATTKSLVKYTTPDGKTGTLNAEQYASTYEDLLDQGYTFDFSDFNKVVKGKLAPLFNKAMKLQGKFGPENMFVLTARPPQAQKAIFDFLKANGLNIPLKNITGLGNSTAEAKALWIADKVGDGYNDFYFADDALQNVQAVKNMLDQFDVKSKVQQAKVKFGKSMNDQFNDILEDVTGIEAKKRFSAIKGRKRGESKGKFRFFIPPSHEDFVGLLYNFLGKGKQGNAHRDFFEKALIRPLNRANREYDTARQSVANDYKALNKQFIDVRKKLTKKTPDGDFTFQDAIRVYLWNKHGHSIPGLSETDQTSLSELVIADSKLQSYAEALNVISKQDTYVTPTEGWNSGDIRMDLDDATGRIGRQQFFSEFIENADIIFSEENLNKIEAGYGKGVRSSLEDMLYRIKTGRNRPTGQNAQVNKLMNYLNGSVGTVMFFNMRSALLQQMSLVNYINFADNNIFAAAKAFANQKQYWKDWAFIFNSDMLKQRRGGIQTDVNGAELAASLRNSKDITRKLISKLLELGFLPTQIGDNIAIATGGAPFYRNRINTYLKQGLSKKEAEAKAFDDFQATTQSTQQSARPDMVSKQQASVIGKVILNFQNVTSQFNRLGKKAFQDIYNRRITKPNTTQMQSDISNAARITYYFAVQNAIFYTLQTALFAMMFDDDEEDVNNLFIKKKERLINGSIDSVLRGSGLIGGVVATLKNVAIAFARQRDVKYNPDESAVMLEALNLSPVLGIKARKIVNAEKTLNYNKKVIDEMETFDIDNPQWSAVTNYTEAITNVPLNRLYNKTQNVRQALNNEHAAWERTLMFLGWSQYNLNLENKKMEDIKEKVKGKKKKSKKRKTTRIINL